MQNGMRTVGSREAIEDRAKRVGDEAMDHDGKLRTSGGEELEDRS